MQRKTAEIKCRIESEKKKIWKLHCAKKGISLSNLIISSVEGRIMDNERREILKFIEKQDNIFAKIENNLNQLAKIANGQKYLTSEQAKQYLDMYAQILVLKEEQNLMFRKIYAFVSLDDSKDIKFIK